MGISPRPFDTAVERAVELLGRAGPDVTAFFARHAGSDLVVTHTAGAGGAVHPGAELRWPDRGPELFVVGRDLPLEVATRSAAAVRMPSGEAVGVLAVLGSEDTSTVEALASLIGAVAGLELDLGEQRARASQAEADALFDPLTGLGNRRYWMRLVEVEDSRSRRHGEAAAVIVADLDQLKEVNDELGHAAGDDVLRRTAGVLRRISREHDGVARLGGDEFGLLAVGCGQAAAESLGRRLQEALAAEGIPASVGFAGRHPAGGLAHAWRRADAVMYDDKRRRAAARLVDLTSTTAGQGAG